MEIELRSAAAEDADGISRVILAALRETNATDYPPAVIERVERSFGPAAVRGLIAERAAFVALSGVRLVGTASLDGRVMRTVFVHPDMQGRGIGRLLVGRVERAARDAGVAVLSVPSSVTAEGFYRELGYGAVRDSHHGEERTVVMERDLAAPYPSRRR